MKLALQYLEETERFDQELYEIWDSFMEDEELVWTTGDNAAAH